MAAPVEFEEESAWYEDRKNLHLTAMYMYDEGYEAGDFVDLIEKPQNYTAEYRAALAEAEEPIDS